jgi:hypothetical protein
MAGTTRVVVLLLLACLTISCFIGIVTPETGVLEKVVLLALMAGCLFLAAKVSTSTAKAQARNQRH